MARVFDVIEYLDRSGREMVHRIPEGGSGDFRIGSQLIVRESQSAVFFRDGKALDTFGPGRHTLTTANIPFLANLVGKVFGGETPFKAEVYFVNTRQFLDQKWGTAQPITLRDSELGMVRLRAFGTYAIQIADAQLFVNTIVGTRGLYNTSDIDNYLRGIIISRFTDLLGTAKTSILDLPTLFDEISAGTKAKVKDDFAAVGIDMRAMYIESVTPTEETQKAIDERASMGAIGDMQKYLQFKAARALGDAAQQEGGAGGAGEAGGFMGAGLGLGAGMGMGAMMANIMGTAYQQMPGAAGGQVPPAAAAGAAAAAAGVGTISCSNCQAILPANAKFCSNCGAKIGGAMICSNCHAELAPDAKFCTQCGTKVE
ncbi:MAG: SPFH domain-containing protein [Chloroflexi bacterium]|nr:SPFH domain-containing protein [Chloroflexota bacterium]